MTCISTCALNPPHWTPLPHGRGWTVKDNTIKIEWMDDFPVHEELLKLSSCKCSGKESQCNTTRFAMLLVRYLYVTYTNIRVCM